MVVIGQLCSRLSIFKALGNYLELIECSRNHQIPVFLLRPVTSNFTMNFRKQFFPLAKRCFDSSKSSHETDGLSCRTLSETENFIKSNYDEVDYYRVSSCVQLIKNQSESSTVGRLSLFPQPSVCCKKRREKNCAIIEFLWHFEAITRTA